MSDNHTEPETATTTAEAPVESPEIIITRLFDAPPKLVFEAFTDADVLGEWWGPDGFTTTTKSFDFRPDGSWDFIMHGPDGTDYPNYIHFREIVEPERIVHDHAPVPRSTSSKPPSPSRPMATGRCSRCARSTPPSRPATRSSRRSEPWKAASRRWPG